MSILLLEYKSKYAEKMNRLDCSPKSYQNNHKTSLSHDEFNKDIEVSIRQGNLYYALFADKTIIGFAVIIPDNRFDSPNKTASIEYYIDKKYQKKGIGKELIRLIIDKAKKKRFRKLMAFVYVRNYPSRKVLEKAKFRKVGVLRNHLKYNTSNKYCSLIIYEYLI